MVKHNKELLEKDIKGLLNVKKIIPKEIIVDFVNKTYKPNLPVRSHDTVDHMVSANGVGVIDYIIS